MQYYKQLQIQEQVLESKLQRENKYTKYKHTGFDFAGEAGHDKIITDNLFNRMQSAIHNQLYGKSYAHHNVNRSLTSERK